MPKIDLNTQLTLRTAFAFPIQNTTARNEIIVGGLLLLLPFVGWLLNMGHRISMIHAMHNGKEPWPSWRSWRLLLTHGFITFVGMVYYYLPSLVLLVIYLQSGSAIVAWIAAVLFVLATLAIPGYMTQYCKNFEPSEIFNPFKALRRSIEGGKSYWKAWVISLTALLISLLGLLLFGVGFLFSSVWFWQVAGYSFANVFTKQFALATTPLSA